MSAGWAVLWVAGLVGVPVWLLQVGHRLRSRGVRTRGAFWGGVIGWAVSVVALLTLLLSPPMVWPPPGGAPLVVALTLLPAAFGACVGAVIGRAHPRRLQPRTRSAPEG